MDDHSREPRVRVANRQSPLRQSGAKCWAGMAACVLVELRISEALGAPSSSQLYAYTPRSSCTAATRLIASM